MFSCVASSSLNFFSFFCIVFLDFASPGRRRSGAERSDDVNKMLLSISYSRCHFNSHCRTFFCPIPLSTDLESDVSLPYVQIAFGYVVAALQFNLDALVRPVSPSLARLLHLLQSNVDGEGGEPEIEVAADAV